MRRVGFEGLEGQLADRDDFRAAALSDELGGARLGLDDGLQQREPGLTAALEESGQAERVARVGLGRGGVVVAHG